MSRTVLGIYNEAGPVLIRNSEGSSKPSSQDMAVLGSMVTYAEGIGVQFSSVATDDFTIGFKRYCSCYRYQPATRHRKVNLLTELPQVCS